MKQLFTEQKGIKWLFVVVLLLAAGCTPASHEEWQVEQDRRCAQRITKFNYEGHSYLLYRDGGNGNCAIAGITHDANCPCRNAYPANAGESVIESNDTINNLP